MSGVHTPTPIKASVLGDRGVFIWQKAVHVAADLPESVRYSLSVLALYMNLNGTYGRPGFQKFAAARRVSEKTLQRHLERATNAGWLVLAQRGGRNGDGTTRANSYSAAIPVDVWSRLNEILGPVWGDLPMPTTPSQPDTLGCRVEKRPVEGFSTGHTVISTGHLRASTSQPACPPTAFSHRPDTPISQSVQRAEAHALLHRLYGLTDDQATVITEEARRRAAEPIRSLARYLEEMADRGDLTVLVEAVHLADRRPLAADADEDEAERGGRGALTRPPLCSEHPGGPEDHRPIGMSRCLICNDRRRLSQVGGPPVGLLAGLRDNVRGTRDRKRQERPGGKPVDVRVSSSVLGALGRLGGVPGQFH